MLTKSSHCISISLVAVISFQIGVCFEEHWDGYKNVYNKTFSHPDEESIKRTNWEWAVKKILQHNALHKLGNHSYSLKANHMADMHRHDYLKMIGLIPSRRRKVDPHMLEAPPHRPNEIPEEFDWRKLGYVTPSLNQNACGSCYAFTVAASIQAQMFKKFKKLDELSEQQLVDCSILTGNKGCDGGSFRNSLRYVKIAGLMKHRDYPYKGKQSLCQYSPLKERARFKTWKVLPVRDEYSLKVAVATIGPLAVSVNANPYTFQFYHRGVYDDPECPDDSVNHAMLLVGYTKDTWILKNWWTDRWGVNGYMYIKRGVNRCGISNYAVVVEG